MNKNITAQGWFSLGERVSYDHRTKNIIRQNGATESADIVQIFRRVARNGTKDERAVWTTFLPGFPDGSFGWARVDKYLASTGFGPKLFVEYVGQGDSDKPSGYPYSTIERADLVEALWQAEGIRSTFVVAFDYSALVVLELLSRQQERHESGAHSFTRINRVLMINGGLFADGHSHPWFTTPLLKTPIGKVGTWVAQRSRLAFDQMVKVLWSKDYKVTPEELQEVYEAITRRNGAAFMSNAAEFVDEHKSHAERWDLRRLFFALRESVSFHVVGSTGDPFEPNQIVKAKERLGQYGLDIRTLPGGHLTTSEHPERLVEIILELGPKQ